MGTANSGPLMARFHYGRKAYYTGGHPAWELTRGIFQMRSIPVVIGGHYFMAGYIWAGIARMNRPVSAELMAFHRKEQLTRLRLPQEARKNTRRAAKKGIEIRSAALDNDFTAGIKAIYDEAPLRQGRKFWHYGKDLDTIKRENGTYLDRCEFLGAYYGKNLYDRIHGLCEGPSGPA